MVKDQENGVASPLDGHFGRLNFTSRKSLPQGTLSAGSRLLVEKRRASRCDSFHSGGRKTPFAKPKSLVSPHSSTGDSLFSRFSSRRPFSPVALSPPSDKLVGLVVVRNTL
jgi:hypothetical protein